MLKTKDQLPVVAFTLSKRKCDSNADQIRNIDLVTPTERSHITTFFNRSVSRLKGMDRMLPQVLTRQYGNIKMASLLVCNFLELLKDFSLVNTNT